MRRVLVTGWRSFALSRRFAGGSAAPSAQKEPASVSVTPPPKPKAGSNPFPAVLITAAALAGGAYYYYTTVQPVESPSVVAGPSRLTSPVAKLNADPASPSPRSVLPPASSNSEPVDSSHVSPAPLDSVQNAREEEATLVKAIALANNLSSTSEPKPVVHISSPPTPPSPVVLESPSNAAMLKPEHPVDNGRSEGPLAEPAESDGLSSVQPLDAAVPAAPASSPASSPVAAKETGPLTSAVENARAASQLWTLSKLTDVLKQVSRFRCCACSVEVDAL
jgi:hypothetical protein